MAARVENIEAPAATMAKPFIAKWLRHTIWPAVPVLILIAVWWLLSDNGAGANATFVSPGRLVERFDVLWSKGYQGVPLVQQILASLLRTLAGFVVAGVLGVPLGLLMGMSARARWLLSPLFAMLRPIPAIAFIPL